MNDAVLAVMAGALRTYFIAHDELPAEPLAVSVPVGADDPGVIRRMGNNVTTLFTMRHTEIEDPLERARAIRKDAQQGRADLDRLVDAIPAALSELQAAAGEWV